MLSKRMTPVLLVAAAWTVFLSMAATPSEAISNKIVIEFYYSDPDFTNEVGHRTVLRCSGSQTGTLFGTHGEYTQVQEIICRDGVMLGDPCFKVRWSECPLWTVSPNLASVNQCRPWAIPVFSAASCSP